jgi:hypothetical protein
MEKQKKYNEMKNPLHIAKHIVRLHQPQLKPKPAKELVYFASTDFAETKKLNL